MTFFFPFDVEAYQGIGYLAIGAINLLSNAAMVSLVPAWIVIIAASSYLNPVVLVLLAAVTASTGELTDFIFGDGIEKMINDTKWHRRITNWFDKAPFLFLIIWVAIPNPIQAIGQIYAGSTKYPIWKYWVASVIGNSIWYTMVVFFGVHIGG